MGLKKKEIDKSKHLIILYTISVPFISTHTIGLETTCFVIGSNLSNRKSSSMNRKK